MTRRWRLARNRLNAPPPEDPAEVDRLTRALTEAERANQTMIRALIEAGERLTQAHQTNRSLAGKVVRAEAEQRRLRHALTNARPRITVAEPPRVPPFAALALPYPVPVQGPDTPVDVS